MNDDPLNVPRLMINRRSLLAGAAATLAFGSAARAGGVRRSDLDTFLMAQMRTASIPGLAVGIAQRGKVEFTRGYGFADLASRRPVTTKTMFSIASLTKTVTATAVMMLVEAGRIGLDDPVNRHLDFAVVNPAHRDVPITVRHLLMHVSSISDKTYYKVDFRTPGKDSPLSIGDFLRSYLGAGGRNYSVSGSFSTSAPGTTYDYCNVGFGLLGYLGSRVAGMDLRIFTRERLFSHLGMRHVSWTLADVPPAIRATPYDVVDGRLSAVMPVGFPDWSAGMLRASIADFMRFVAASSNGGAANGVRMIGAATQALMLNMQTPSGLPAWLTGQGMGWMASREGGISRINHWGGDPGVFTAAYLDPTLHLGVAIFANISATDASKTAIKAIAARLLEAGDPR